MVQSTEQPDGVVIRAAQLRVRHKGHRVEYGPGFMFGGTLVALRRYRNENGERKVYLGTNDGRSATLAHDSDVRLTKEAP